MDNLTHGLLGIAIGMVRRRDGDPSQGVPLTATDKAVPWATLIAAELPDLDIFLGSGPMAGYVYHRGLTHSIFMAPVVAAVATGLVKLVWREAKLSTLFLWSLASVLIAHLLNDWLTGWGTRLLLPFSEARLGLDWLPIVDLLFTLPLLGAVVLAWKRPEHRRRAMIGVLTYLAVYSFGYRGIAHTLTDRAVRAEYQGQGMVQMQVSPDLFNPLAWQYVVDLGDRYAVAQAYPLRGSTGEIRTIRKMPEDAVILAVRQAPELSPYFQQFAYPLITYQTTPTGFVATLVDVRYERAGMAYAVELDSDLKVVAIH